MSTSLFKKNNDSNKRPGDNQNFYNIFSWINKKNNFLDTLICFLLVFFCCFFLFVFYGPFKNISYNELIVHQRWEKTGEPGENHLTIRKQNLAFPYVTRVRLEPQQWETKCIKSQLSYPLGYGAHNI